MEEFLRHMADILEVKADDIHPKTNFREDVPDWDSMKGFAILCMMEDEYRVRISVPVFLMCETIADLYMEMEEIWEEQGGRKIEN